MEKSRSGREVSEEEEADEVGGGGGGRGEEEPRGGRSRIFLHCLSRVVPSAILHGAAPPYTMAAAAGGAPRRAHRRC